MDIERVMRLRGAILASLSAVPADQSSAFEGLSASYERRREEVHQAVADSIPTEFDRLFPAAIDRSGVGGGRLTPQAIFGQQEVASTARTLLGQLAGWLEGIIEGSQVRERMRLEAEAYARERVRVEQDG